MRTIQEADGQPTDHVGHVNDACKDEEDCFDAGGGEDTEEHLVGVALGNNSEASQ